MMREATIPVDIATHLPLRLIKSQVIPPAPSRTGDGSEPVADLLHNFSGLSWIAYGASSLLVISHLPNPMSGNSETKIGSICQQMLDLSVYVSSVSWSPVMPSDGELAVALDDCIVLFSCNRDEASISSFSWRQHATLVQSMKVEAIKWTGSGDGIISVGMEVVVWRRKEKSWQIAWKFEPKIPQSLVSTTWSADGFSATAPGSQLHNEDSFSSTDQSSNSVFVCKSDGTSKYALAKLHHPMSVCMIQWRPSTGRPQNRHSRHIHRPVLLSCSLDGAVRLWGEIDDGRVRRPGKDTSEQKAVKLSFCVVAVIEVNQILGGFLGSNVFVSWATEVEEVVIIDQEASLFSSLNNLSHNTAGICEWLVGFGPERATTFWAFHCLDDLSPVRFPRVTLWKKLDLLNFEMESSKLLVHKVLMTRNQPSGPPVICSLIQLLASNDFSWTHLYSHVSASMEGKSVEEPNAENNLTLHCQGGVKADGHTGKVLQIAINPFSFEYTLSASLDENGTLIFWSSSKFFNSYIGVPLSTPSWQLRGKVSIADHSSNYTCLSWAPASFGNEWVLLMGQRNNIDFFIVIPLKDNDKVIFQKLFTIPISIDHEKVLSRLCSLPLSSNCNGNFMSSKFLLVALSVDRFQALSWEITIHCYDIEDSYCAEHSQAFESELSGKKYSVSVDPYSSEFPVSYDDDKVISCSVIDPSGMVLSQRLSASSESGNLLYAYHLVTGCENGTLKLWKSRPSVSSPTPWQLIGVLDSGQGPIMAVSSSASCQKIAASSPTDHQNCCSTLCIWECMPIHSAGSFILEEKLCFDGNIIAVNWLMLGNGQLLLGVCLENELRVYAASRRGGQYILRSKKAMEGNGWVCIAASTSLSDISNFHWGPKGTLMVVHDEYFSIFSHFLLLAEDDGKNHTPSPVYADSSNTDSKRRLMKISGQCNGHSPKSISVQDDLKPITMAGCQHKLNWITRTYYWSMSEIAKTIGGSVPLFHPEALLVNISSGNWKRALVALRHLVKHLTPRSVSEVKCSRGRNTNLLPVSPSNYLDCHLSPSSSDNLMQWSTLQLQTIGQSQFDRVGAYDTQTSVPTSSSSRSEFTEFVEAFERLHSAACITEGEKMQALALIDLLQEISNVNSTAAYGSLDDPGRRFWVAVRFQQICFGRHFTELSLVEELVVSSGLIGWAFHSDCPENLFSSLLSSEPSWEEMRSLGVGFWYTDVTQLRVKMERLARQRYMKNKDPKECALLYIALGRLQVLAGLFKISRDDKDKPLAGFICRNFQEDKNKAAALKNAYVLMSRHQLELATAFFLLGGDVSSAVTVCAKNLGDEQLALVICRLIEGYSGPLEQNLISKVLLPSVLSKGNFWMASILEWTLGNYSQSFMRMLGLGMRSEHNTPVLQSSQAPFLDPSIGQFCQMLAAKTNMKNAVGEPNASILCRWAALMNVTSLSRCGLPLEALECLSSSVSLFSGHTDGNPMHIPNQSILVEMMKPLVDQTSLNWLSDDIESHLVSCHKLYLAMRYISDISRGYLSYVNSDTPSFGEPELIYEEADGAEFLKLLKQFNDHLVDAVAYFQKFSLLPQHLISLTILDLDDNGLEYISLFIMQDHLFESRSQAKGNWHCSLLMPPSSLLSTASEELSCIYAKYVLSSFNFSTSTCLIRNSLSSEGGFCHLATWSFTNQGIVWALKCLRALFLLFVRPYREDSLKLVTNILVLVELHILSASSWLQKNFKALILIFEPILVMLQRGGSVSNIKLEDLNKFFPDVVEILTHDSPCVECGQRIQTNRHDEEHSWSTMKSLEDENNLRIVIASLWMHMSKFLQHQLQALSKATDESSASPSQHTVEAGINNLQLKGSLPSNTLVEFLELACTSISFLCSKQFANHLLQEVNKSNESGVFYLRNGISHLGDVDTPRKIESMQLNNSNKKLDFEQFWDMCANPVLIRGAFSQEYHNWLSYFKQKFSSGWCDAYKSITREFESDENCDKEDHAGSPTYSRGSPLACLSPDDHPFKNPVDKCMNHPEKVIPFHNPREVHKRNGELLEALCINSTDHFQVALASNKKGIIFFNWEDGAPHRDISEYVWGEADWPHNGYASSDSVPVPTPVSPGVGLGSKKGTHLGLGGAMIGSRALTRPNRDLTGGRAFGIPGYAGVGASGLGWEVQENFDEFLDPPATVDNVRTRAFASHPLRPFFLVGSSNTHVYMWEFGKDKATATYGVLPAANIPPPYALASVSAVRFDNCGQRFVTAALDGTVCTWQLEVGGRSNICPTESSVCFNNYTSDATYVTASGSIVAAAGYSSNSVNVVVWDTLAPPATSRASIMCHEGGARSISVFDNDIGSGSISPLILTGGKSGDVGLHDFRYIATGRTKKHKHLDTGEHYISASSSVDVPSKTGEQNRNGMLWYIPKAHSACVTKIATIPNTSFFLTGSKDGDVKLWDATRARLVYHWPKLHEKHTFLQPSSRGFGGLVRVAVTDIQVVSHGFLTCGGDGLVKYVRFRDFPISTT